jgi:hypothetical protein
MSIMNDFDTSSTAYSGMHGLPGQARVMALDHSASLSLAADTHDRLLQLEQGQHWLTCTRRGLAHARPRVGAGQIDPASADVAARDQSDIWLAAGESVQLPAASHWVLQAWPEARLTLRVTATEPKRGRNADTRHTHTGWLHRAQAAAQRLLPHHTRQPAAQAGGMLTGAGCN